MTDQDPFFRAQSEMWLVACLMSGNQDVALDILDGVRESKLTSQTAQDVFAVSRRLVEEGKPVDLMSVVGNWSKVHSSPAPMTDLSQAMDQIASPNQWPDYRDDIEDAYRRRSLRGLAQDLSDACSDLKTQIEDAQRRAENALLSDFDAPAGIHTARDVTKRLVDDLQARHDRRGQLAGISYGIRRLDSMTEGLQPGEVVVVGARPSVGKTAFGVTLLHNVALVNRVPCLFITLETDEIGIDRRLMANVSGVPIGILKSGAMNEAQARSIAVSAAKIAGSPFWIANGTQGLDGPQVASIIRRSSRRHGVRVCIIDYIQRMKVSGTAEKRTYGIAANSEAICAAAKGTGVAVIMMAQLNRDAEGNDKVPTIRDLAECGQIERDGDTILLLHRDRMIPIGPASVIVAKARDGECGMITMNYHGPTVRFDEVEQKPD